MNPSVVPVNCPACKGVGTYRMGCAVAVCHVCRGRGFLREQMRGVASVVPNRGKRGGESKIKSVAMLVLGLLACLLLAPGCGHLIPPCRCVCVQGPDPRMEQLEAELNQSRADAERLRQRIDADKAAEGETQPQWYGPKVTPEVRR
jgi:hypothetical protein